MSSFLNALGGLAGYGSTTFRAKKFSPAEETAVTAASTFAGINKDGEDDAGISYDDNDSSFDINDDVDEYESNEDESDEEEVSEFICEMNS